MSSNKSDNLLFEICHRFMVCIGFKEFNIEVAQQLLSRYFSMFAAVAKW